MKQQKNSPEVNFTKKTPVRKRYYSYLSKLFKLPKWQLADEVGIIIFTAFIIATTLFYFNNWQFSSEEWARSPSKRYEIVDDLLDSEILDGKTKQEVLSILGEPYPYINKDSNTLIYEMGKPPAFFEEKIEFLKIVFNQGIVIDISIETE